MIWCFVSYVCSFHLSQKTNWQLFRLARYGRFSIFRFCVSVRKYFTDLWTQQLSINMLQNCTEHVILVDKQLSFYSTFWSDPIFMPKLANTWQRRLHSGSIFADFRLFLSHLLTEVPENWSKCVSWLAISWLPIILLQVPHQASYTYQNKPISYRQVFCESRILQFFSCFSPIFGHESTKIAPNVYTFFAQRSCELCETLRWRRRNIAPDEMS